MAAPGSKLDAFREKTRVVSPEELREGPVAARGENLGERDDRQ